MDAEYAMGPFWRVGGGYFYNLATVTSYAANPALVGKYLPQVPKHRGSFQVAYANPRLFTLAFSLQAVGNQFDDDQNSRIVPGYTSRSAEVRALRHLGLAHARHGVDVFFARRTSSIRPTTSARCRRRSVTEIRQRRGENQGQWEITPLVRQRVEDVVDAELVGVVRGVHREESPARTIPILGDVAVVVGEREDPRVGSLSSNTA
jgi:hypothetical protein